MTNTGFTIDDVLLTPLKVFNVPDGDVLHGIRSSDPGYMGFGEAYFSTIEYSKIKGWKRHFDMIMNLVVPVGSVRFVMHDTREQSRSHGNYQEVVISRDNYIRLTIPPMIWVAFQGMSKTESVLLNISNIEHNQNEVEKKSIDRLDFDWGVIK